MIEGLEPRCHCARIAIAVEGKRLLITGTERDDEIYVSGQRHRIEITISGKTQTIVNDAVRTVRIDGGRGDDVIHCYGFFGPVHLTGGGGDDDLFGTAQGDTLVGGAGNDTLDGADGNDSLRGDAGDDLINGGAGADTLIGGENNDELHGGTGNDFLNGNAGDDHLLDKQGVNVFHGGGGTDRAVTDDYGITTGIESGGSHHFQLTRAGGHTNLAVSLVDGVESLSPLTFRDDGFGELIITTDPGSVPPFANATIETRDVSTAIANGLYLTYATRTAGSSVPDFSFKFLLPASES